MLTMLIKPGSTSFRSFSKNFHMLWRWGLTICELQQHCQQHSTWCRWDRSNFCENSVRFLSNHIENLKDIAIILTNLGASVASLNFCFNMSQCMKLYIWILNSPGDLDQTVAKGWTWKGDSQMQSNSSLPMISPWNPQPHNWNRTLYIHYHSNILKSKP